MGARRQCERIFAYSIHVYYNVNIIHVYNVRIFRGRSVPSNLGFTCIYSLLLNCHDYCNSVFFGIVNGSLLSMQWHIRSHCWVVVECIVITFARVQDINAIDRSSVTPNHRYSYIAFVCLILWHVLWGYIVHWQTVVLYYTIILWTIFMSHIQCTWIYLNLAINLACFHNAETGAPSIIFIIILLWCYGNWLIDWLVDWLMVSDSWLIDWLMVSGFFIRNSSYPSHADISEQCSWTTTTAAVDFNIAFRRPLADRCQTHLLKWRHRSAMICLC